MNDLNPCDSKSGTLGNTRMDMQYLWGNTCGETLVGNTPKIRCLQAGHSQALIKPRTVVAGATLVDLPHWFAHSFEGVVEKLAL